MNVRTLTVLAIKIRNVHFRMYDVTKRKLVSSIIEEVEVYPERQAKGQWLKFINFKIPTIEDSFDMRLDKDKHIETVVKLSR